RSGGSGDPRDPRPARSRPIERATPHGRRSADLKPAGSSALRGAELGRDLLEHPSLVERDALAHPEEPCEPAARGLGDQAARGDQPLDALVALLLREHPNPTRITSIAVSKSSSDGRCSNHSISWSYTGVPCVTPRAAARSSTFLRSAPVTLPPA